MNYVKSEKVLWEDKTLQLQMMDPLECHVIVYLFIKLYIHLHPLGVCRSQEEDVWGGGAYGDV